MAMHNIFKKIILLFSLPLMIASCQQEEHNSAAAGTTTDSTASANMVFDTEAHDFGTVLQGEKVKYSFSFENKGNAELIISEARGSCGCTVPTYARQPIKPGEKGKIDVVFNSENLAGISEKNVIVLSNSKPNSLKNLVIRANVIPSEK